jgi:hypothetical protein
VSIIFFYAKKGTQNVANFVAQDPDPEPVPDVRIRIRPKKGPDITQSGPRIRNIEVVMKIEALIFYKCA